MLWHETCYPKLKLLSAHEQDTLREDSDTVQWPHISDPQDEPSLPMPQEEPADEQHDPQQRSKGKEPQRLNYTLALSESDAGSSQTAPAPPPAPDASTAGLMHGQPIPWELDPERPAQKLPLRFKDALGRTMLIPWRRAKTWEVRHHAGHAMGDFGLLKRV